MPSGIARNRFCSRESSCWGCVVDAAHRFLAVGAHLDYGHSHAEVNVFDKLPQGARLKNATLYVTLEPCSHNGKTPACATMLLGRSLRKIVVASLDPNPLVNGQGRKILENSGCLFEVSSKFAEMASDLHESFIWNIQHSLPFIGLKAAVSMDGLASRSGASRAWITGVRSRSYGHWLRMRYEGIVVRLENGQQDNPKLNVRRPDLPRCRSPHRIVLDPAGQGLRSRPLEQHSLLASELEKPSGFYRRGCGNTT